MAITATHLVTNRSSTDQTAAYTTISITPTTNRLVLAWIVSQHAGTPPTPTLSGNSLTWVEVDSNLNPAGNRRLTLFRAMGTATSGAVSIDHAGASMIGCAWSISEFAGINTSGTNGSGAIGAFDLLEGIVTATTASISLTFSDVNNATVGALFIGNNEALTQGSGFTLLGQIAGANPNTSLGSEFVATNDTSADWSWTTSSVNFIVGAVEIKSADQTKSVSALSVPITLPQATATASDSATPAALSVPVTLPAPTVTASSTATPGTISVALTLPAPTVTAGGTASPAALSVPITLSAPTLLANSTASPGVLSVPITLPTPTVTAGGTALPAALSVSITIPQVAVTADSVATPSAFTVPITIPQVTATSSADATATPGALTVPITLPQATTLADSTATPDPIVVSIALPQVTATGDAVVPPAQVVGGGPSRGKAKYEPEYPTDAVARPAPVRLQIRTLIPYTEDHHDFSFEDEEVLLLL